MCCYYSHWGMLKIPVASPLKKVSSSPPHPCQWLSIVESYTSISLSQFLGVLFNAFPSRLLLLRWGWFSQKPFVSLLIESAGIHTTEEGPLSFTVRGSIDHELQRDFWQQHEQGTFTWLLASLRATDLSVVSTGSPGHGHQHSPPWQPRPGTSIWL